MKAIYKYAVGNIEQGSYDRMGCFVLELPLRAQVVSAGSQDSELVIWAEVDLAENCTEERAFRLLGTGWNFQERVELKDSSNPNFHIEKRPVISRLINTVTTHDGFVFHVFEELLGEVQL